MDVDADDGADVVEVGRSGATKAPPPPPAASSSHSSEVFQYTQCQYSRGLFLFVGLLPCRVARCLRLLHETAHGSGKTTTRLSAHLLVLPSPSLLGLLFLGFDVMVTPTRLPCV